MRIPITDLPTQSLHEDENHADTVLRGAKVCVLQGAGPVPRVEQHEYFVRSAYDSESLFDITDVDLIPKKVRAGRAPTEARRGFHLPRDLRVALN